MQKKKRLLDDQNFHHAEASEIEVVKKMTFPWIASIKLVS